MKSDLTNAAVLFSGGIDSSACAHLLKSQGYKVQGIFIDFEQAALAQETKASQSLSKILEIDLINIKASSSSTFGKGELIGRNAFFIFSAIFLAKIHQGVIAIGIHAGTPYYDCSTTFLEKMKQLAEEHTDGNLTVVAPFIEWNKRQIYEYFLNSGLPLQDTYSCELGEKIPCELCASCLDRKHLHAC